MYQKLSNFFDRLEDRVRGRLSRYPGIYAFIAGTCMILFWRGIWIMTDGLSGTEASSGLVWVLISTVIMLLTGVFTTSFIGERIIISGLKGEKKDIEKTQAELEEDEDLLIRILREIRTIKKEVEGLKK